MLARPATNAFLLGRETGAFLRQANIQQKTQRLERLMVGVRAFFGGIVTIVVFAHRQQEASAKSAALALAFELPALFAVVDLRAFYAGVALDISRSVLVAVGFGLGRHARQRRQQSPVQQFVDFLAALAVGNEAQHHRQPVGKLAGVDFEAFGPIGFLEPDQEDASFVVLAEQLIAKIRMADRVQVKKTAVNLLKLTDRLLLGEAAEVLHQG